jgi:anti-anti-sigma factor
VRSERLPADDPSHFEISVLEEGHQTLVRCSGTIDIAVRGVLSERVREVLSAGVRPPIVLDLTGIELIDSMGLQELVQAVLACDRLPVPWAIRPSPAVRRLLALVGMGRLRSDQTGGWLSGGGYGDE